MITRTLNLASFARLPYSIVLQKKSFTFSAVLQHFFVETGTANMGSEHHLSLDTPILYLKSEEAFGGLTDRERKYAHYLSKASWWGGMITLCQSSPESPTIFSMLTKLYRSQPFDTLKDVALTKAGFNEDEFNLLNIYYSTFTYNLGNYLGFGDRKFVPTLSKDKLHKLIKLSKAYLEDQDKMTKYMDTCLEPMYDLSESKRFLGLPEKGVTMYFTSNCTKEDADLATEYMTARNLEGWNSRFIKCEKEGNPPLYEIRLASMEGGKCEGVTMDTDEYKGHKFCITRGDYSFIFENLNKELEKAKEFASNDLERSMLGKYIESFKTGSQQEHRNGSIDWVKNQSPAIETYMGFIEAYRDPTNQRAEFESFVAAVNREQSKKFDALVARASQDFLPLLPWGKDFENDMFIKPDYSSLDIITFACSGLPIGINIPNYKDIIEDFGFKNVTLSNVISARMSQKESPFLSESDKEAKQRLSSVAIEIQVGLHELLGHGSGKFLRRKLDGTFNFDPSKVKNPFTGSEVLFYETGENYQSVFTDISSAYEECRAEAVAIYLVFVDGILDIFGIDSSIREDLIYVSWLDMMYAGLCGLEMYQPTQGKWGQAHCRARYVLLRVLLEAGEGIVTITETLGADGLPDLILSLDRNMISTVGRTAIGNFLKKMQVYRSMGDGKSARTMFEKYSEVPKDGPHPFANWHNIVMRKRKPRMVLTMPNTRLSGDCVDLISYPDGAEGQICSWVERFTSDEYNKIEEYLSSFSLE